jgi:hypothetical protein
LLGIDASLIALRSGSTNLQLRMVRGTRSYFDQKTGAEINETNSLAVFLARRLDGIPVRGWGDLGGLYIDFGNNGRVIDLKASWRNLQPYELRQTTRPSAFAEQIRTARIPLHPIDSETAIVREPVYKLTVRSLNLVYDGEVGYKPMKLVFPFARFEALAETPNRTLEVWFYCPMVSTGSEAPTQTK